MATGVLCFHRTAHMLTSCRDSQALPHLQQAHIGVRDGRDLAMHDARGGAHDAPAEYLPNALVPHAHAEQRHARPQLPDRLQGDARVLWPPCTGARQAPCTDSSSSLL